MEIFQVGGRSASDVRAATELLRAQLRDRGGRVSRGQVERGVSAALAGGSPSVLLLARSAGRAVGVCLFHVFPSIDFGGRAVWVEELYVAERARREGVATRLLREVERLGVAAGASAADLEVAATQRGAMELYRRRGYRELDRVRLSRGFREAKGKRRRLQQ